MNAFARGERPRYSARALPPYSYVPGYNQHPVSHPQGHMHGHAPQASPPLATDAWQASEEYRYGVDLFNHGFYWEAHEAWESLWHAAGRRGPIGLWLKALIKLSASAVKLREGNSNGALHHATRARELVGQLRAELHVAPGPTSSQTADAERQAYYCGIAVKEVDEVARALAAEAERGVATPQPDRLLEHWFTLGVER